MNLGLIGVHAIRQHIDTVQKNMKTYSNFTECYKDMLRLTLYESHHVCCPGDNRPAGRGGGQEIRERLCQGFVLSNPLDRLPFVPARDLSMSYAVAELLWYFSGSDLTEWISYYAPFWRNISDDGVTANSAYGARMFRTHHDRVHGDNLHPCESQWDRVVSELRRDPESRRAVIQIRSAADTWLANKDVPCTLALQFFLRDNKLHLVATMRSSDLILGIPYDVIAFTMFQEMMALELNVELGTYMHVSNSMHIYQRDFEMVEKILNADNAAHVVPMPCMPSLPPTLVLGAIETRLRQADSAQQITAHVDESKKVLNRYWADWIAILASNKASRLGLKTLQASLMKSTTYSGYQQFTR